MALRTGAMTRQPQDYPGKSDKTTPLHCSACAGGAGSANATAPMIHAQVSNAQERNLIHLPLPCGGQFF